MDRGAWRAAVQWVSKTTEATEWSTAHFLEVEEPAYVCVCVCVCVCVHAHAHACVCAVSLKELFPG